MNKLYKNTAFYVPYLILVPPTISSVSINANFGIVFYRQGVEKIACVFSRIFVFRHLSLASTFASCFWSFRK